MKGRKWLIVATIDSVIVLILFYKQIYSPFVIYLLGIFEIICGNLLLNNIVCSTILLFVELQVYFFICNLNALF